MKTIDFVFKAPSYGRSISDDKWETIEPAHIELWKRAIKLLSSHKISAREQVYAIDIDWTPTLRSHQRGYTAMQYLLGRKHKSIEQAYKKARFPRQASKNQITVGIGTRAQTNAEMNMAAHAAESLLHDVFLMLNIAAPGSCDFYRASLQGQNLDHDISLSNTHFESALLFNLDHGWPKLSVLSLETVTTWFRSVRQGTSQLPQNAMERVLFALLHMSKIDTSPMMVIWLFYAFESLLQTNVGENFSAIVRRLTLLLEADDKQTKAIRKSMRELYDVRSAIVHGGFEIFHPAHNEILDKRIDEKFEQIMTATDVGHALLLSAIQKTIEKGWKLPKFKEVLEGEEMALPE